MRKFNRIFLTCFCDVTERQLMRDFHAKHMEFHSKVPEGFWPNEYPSDQVCIIALTQMYLPKELPDFSISTTFKAFLLGQYCNLATFWPFSKMQKFWGVKLQMKSQRSNQYKSVKLLSKQVFFLYQQWVT